MVKLDDLTRFLGMLSPAKYGDLRLLRQRDKEVALRERSFDSTEYSWEQVVCRVV
jgi:hypothetical protein